MREPLLARLCQLVAAVESVVAAHAVSEFVSEVQAGEPGAGLAGSALLLLP